MVLPAFFHSANLGHFEVALHQRANTTREIDSFQLHTLIDIDRTIGWQILSTFRVTQVVAVFAFASYCLATYAIQNAATILATFDGLK